MAFPFETVLNTAIERGALTPKNNRIRLLVWNELIHGNEWTEHKASTTINVRTVDFSPNKFPDLHLPEGYHYEDVALVGCAIAKELNCEDAILQFVMMISAKDRVKTILSI